MKKVNRAIALLLSLLLVMNVSLLFCVAGATGKAKTVILLELKNGELQTGESATFNFTVPEDEARVSVNFIGQDTKGRTNGKYELTIFNKTGAQVFKDSNTVNLNDKTTSFKLSEGAYKLQITALSDTFEFACSVSAKIKNDVPVTKLKINKTKIDMTVGDTEKLKVVYEPLYTTYKTVWSSSNVKVATVTANGKVKAKALGVAKITATIGSKRVACKITVNFGKPVTIYPHESISFVNKIKQINNYEKAKWSSTNESVASVNKKGIVSSHKEGMTIVTAKIGKQSFSCLVVVIKSPISSSNITLHVGDTHRLTASGSSKVSSWSSSNPKVVSVDKRGLLKAKKPGKATITAVIEGKEFTCAVYVEELAYGIIEGSVSYFYNYNYGYVADTGAKIYVLDEGKGETVATALADGNGSYSLQVPTGSYKVLIVSAHNKSRDTLQDKEGYKEKFSPYGIYLFSEMISKKDVTVRKNQTVNVSARFEISDF